MLRSRKKGLGALRTDGVPVLAKPPRRLRRGLAPRGLLCLPPKVLALIASYTCPQTARRFTTSCTQTKAAALEHSEFWWHLLPRPLCGWLFTESLGRDAFGSHHLDISPGSGDARDTPGAYWRTEPCHSYAHLEGGHLQHREAALEPILGPEFAVTAWVRVPREGAGRLCIAAKAMQLRGSGGQHQGWSLTVDMRTEALHCLVGGQVYSSGNVPVADGRWHCLALSVGGGRVRIALDGARVADAVAPAAASAEEGTGASEWDRAWGTEGELVAYHPLPWNTPGPLTIGGIADRPEWQFRGQLKHVCIWNCCLDPLQLGALCFGVGAPWRLDPPLPPAAPEMDQDEEALCAALVKQVHRPKSTGMQLAKKKKEGDPRATQAPAPPQALAVNLLD